MKTLLLITTIAMTFTSYAATTQKPTQRATMATGTGKTVLCTTVDKGGYQVCSSCPTNATLKTSAQMDHVNVAVPREIDSYCLCDVYYYASKDGRTCIHYAELRN